MNTNYWQHKVDWALASTLTLGPIVASVTVKDINEYLMLAGGVIGITIGVIRLYRLIRNKDA